MLTEDEIISTLDNSNDQATYNHFIELGHPYIYLIDCRLNIFRGDDDRWAIVAERLGFIDRGSGIELEIAYFGNCLQNLPIRGGHEMKSYSINPIDEESFAESADDIGFSLNPDAKYWLVGGKKVKLSTNPQDYIDNGIELNEYEAGEIGVQEAARLAIINDSEAFMATDEQLYECIPADLKKILVLDEWYHKDFNGYLAPELTPGQLRITYELNKERMQGMSFETFVFMTEQKEAQTREMNKTEWEENRPGSYETWQQLAKVIATGDISFYKPTLPPNTHWTNWPESGSL
ncbi:hypothetical protein KXD93_26915 [Mucilaginibacter sp. BJC16-A38]|uniref:DUF7003 family protein n=1 Tax=Mucilaginibacter phenanthrenivorans TaxID=1234842 RepID=UPI002157E0AE|nr:hypothetical protein [Mucilaginibacter phenanthrenivorans]MCR8561314.1 hypothetical protein [Mucilaginibacter phenanthrenivorans]